MIKTLLGFKKLAISSLVNRLNAIKCVCTECFCFYYLLTTRFGYLKCASLSVISIDISLVFLIACFRQLHQIKICDLFQHCFYVFFTIEWFYSVATLERFVELFQDVVDLMFHASYHFLICIFFYFFLLAIDVT